MKKILVVFILFFLYYNGHAQLLYKNSLNSYSLILPFNWVQISKNEVSEFSSLYGGVTPYDAGFYPKGDHTKSWGAKIILTSFIKKKMTLKEFDKVAIEWTKDFAKIQYRKGDKLWDICKNLKEKQVIYYKEQQCFVTMYSAKSGGVLTTTLAASYYTPNGILMITFGDEANTFNKTMPLYIDVLKSLKK